MEIKYTKRFLRRYKKLIKSNPVLEERFRKQASKLLANYKLGGIHSHKVTIDGIEVFSFSITGDIRAAYYWEDCNIVLLDIGTHNDLYR